MNLVPDRFWNKHNNMEILKIKERLIVISNANIGVSPYGEKEVNKLKFKLEQLMGTDGKNLPTGSMKDIKSKQKVLSDASDDLNELRAMLNDQRRRAKKEEENKC